MIDLRSAPKATTLARDRARDMRHTLLLPLLLLLAAASPVAAQSCATLGGGLDCGAPSRQPVKPLRPPPPARDAESHGNAETTLSNQGASTTLDNRVIDS